MSLVVVDASALIRSLLQAEEAGDLVARLSEPSVLHAPHLVDVEFLNALRALRRRRLVTEREASRALSMIDELALVRHPHHHLAVRIWELRDALSAYDASYVALAEVLNAELITCDGGIARAHGVRARVSVIST